MILLSPNFETMIIQKFGGTSVGNAQRMKQVAELVHDGKRKIVVLSAVSGTTNKLVELSQALYRKDSEAVQALIESLKQNYIQLVDELLKDEKKKEALKALETHWSHIKAFTLDLFTPFEERAVLAQGELISTMLMQFYMEQEGIRSVLIPALDFMRIDQKNEPDTWYIKSNIERLLSAHPEVDLFITQGYICRNHFGEIDNLKRGGSDYTASIVGTAVNAENVQIWTDIDGMHNNDPRIVAETRPIEKLTFEEAAELAYFGAKILHPSSIEPARKANIPVWLKNTMHPEKRGTVISNVSSGSFLKAVAAKDGITAIKIKSDRMLMAYGFLRKVFEVFERHSISIDMITTSEVAVSLTIDHVGDISSLVEDLRGYGTVEVDTDQCIVCVVGHLLQEKPGEAALIFDALRSISLRMISYGGSKNNVSILIDQSQKVEALKALNVGLFNLKADV
jgi:aspartate kinase